METHWNVSCLKRQIKPSHNFPNVHNLSTVSKGSGGKKLASQLRRGVGHSGGEMSSLAKSSHWKCWLRWSVSTPAEATLLMTLMGVTHMSERGEGRWGRGSSLGEVVHFKWTGMHQQLFLLLNMKTLTAKHQSWLSWEQFILLKKTVWHDSWLTFSFFF